MQTAPNWDLQRHTSTWTGVPSVSGAAGAAVPSSGQCHSPGRHSSASAPQRLSVLCTLYSALALYSALSTYGVRWSVYALLCRNRTSLSLFSTLTNLSSTTFCLRRAYGLR